MIPIAAVSESISEPITNIFSLLGSIWTLITSNPLLATLAALVVVAIVGGILAAVLGGKRGRRK